MRKLETKDQRNYDEQSKIWKSRMFSSIRFRDHSWLENIYISGKQCLTMNGTISFVGKIAWWGNRYDTELFILWKELYFRGGAGLEICLRSGQSGPNRTRPGKVGNPAGWDRIYHSQLLLVLKNFLHAKRILFTAFEAREYIHS
jgi:hypothetical protein